MSLDIHWELLDESISNSLIDYLNSRFSQINRPSFIGNIHVSAFHFGSVPPSVIISDLTDPLPEFYLTPEYPISSSESYASSQNSGISDIEVNLRSDDEAAINSDEYEDESSSGRPLMIPGSSYLLSPGIGGGRYADLRSSNWVHQQRLIHQRLNDSNKKKHEKVDTSEKSSSGGSVIEHSNRMVGDDKEELEVVPEGHTWLGRREYDCQLELEIDYKGNMNLTIETELLVNHPTPKFLVLPVTLTLTGLTFSANAMVAYLGDRVDFCFRNEANGDSLLKDITIDSEIGDSGKQVLKNVEKIEKFIMEQLRKVVDDYCVYPNYVCYDL